MSSSDLNTLIGCMLVASLAAACGQADAGVTDASTPPLVSDGNQLSADSRTIVLDKDCSSLTSPDDGNISLTVTRGTTILVRLRYNQGANAFWSWTRPESLRGATFAPSPRGGRASGAEKVQPVAGGSAAYEAVYDTAALTGASYQLNFRCSAAGGEVYVAYLLQLTIEDV